MRKEEESLYARFYYEASDAVSIYRGVVTYEKDGTSLNEEYCFNVYKLPGLFQQEGASILISCATTTDASPPK